MSLSSKSSVNSVKVSLFELFYPSHLFTSIPISLHRSAGAPGHRSHAHQILFFTKVLGGRWRNWQHASITKLTQIPNVHTDTCMSRLIYSRNIHLQEKIANQNAQAKYPCILPFLPSQVYVVAEKKIVVILFLLIENMLRYGLKKYFVPLAPFVIEKAIRNHSGEI